jgi:uncharacterized membrane protein YdfJ with MMPL/SSD domain
MLAGTLALLALLARIAAHTLGGLGGGSDRIDAAPGPDLVISTEARDALPNNAYDVALRTIAARVEADRSVERVRTVDGRKADPAAVLEVSLAGDGRERRAAAERIVSGVDPGPLRLSAGGEVYVALDAGSSLLDDLWRLELLALPLILLALAATFGLRLSLAPVLAAAAGIAGALAGLGVAGLFFDAALLAAVPGAAFGLAMGVELSALLKSRLEDESQLESGLNVLRNTLRDGVEPMGYVAAMGAAASAGLLATGLDAAGSILLACVAGAAFALLSTILAVPALFAIELQAGTGGDEGEDRRLARWLAVPPRLLARGTIRPGLGAAVALGALVALAYPLLDATSAPLEAGDPSGDSLMRDLPLAWAAGAAFLALGFVLRARQARAAILGPLSLLPAAAALGVVAAVFQDGTALPGSLGEPHQLSNAAVASIVAVVGGIGAARTLAASETVHAERELDPGSAGVAERSAALTLPAALVGTIVAGAAGAVLVGADLGAAQELGLGIAVGLVADLFLARAPMLAALARWGGEPVGSGAAIAWPPSWRPRLPRRKSATGSAG